MSKNLYTITESGFQSGYLSLDEIKDERDKRSLRRLLAHPRIAGKTYDDYVLRLVGNHKLCAGRYVGVITMGSGSRIEILPKLAQSNEYNEYNEYIEEAKAAVIRMLCRAYHLDIMPERVTGLNKTHDLYEVLIQLYLSELKKLLQRGLKSSYQTVEDNLPYLKGRLMINEQIKHNAAHRERFYARYDEFTPDRPENRLIRSTVDRLLSVSVDERNRKELRRSQEMMCDIAPSKNIGQDLAAVVDDRTTVDYRRLMRWSRFFLRGSSFDVFSGKENVDALLFPVWELFERYVGETLRRTFKPQGWRVSLQHQRHYLCEYENENNTKKMFRIRPDIVAEKGGRTIILDTKWKLLSPQENWKNYGIKQEDMYQMFAYARIYGASDIWLLYPKPLRTKTVDIPRCFELPDGVKAHIKLIDLCGKKEDDLSEPLKEVEGDQKQ